MNVARYAATGKSVRPIFANVAMWPEALFFGWALAMVLYIIGSVLRYRVRGGPNLSLPVASD